MRKYVTLPIEQLVSDVAVDPVHVRELADSIMARGQLNPIVVREETKEIIDGFHRVAAMKELGFNQVECVLTPCTDEEFWDFRIIQASLHKNVTFARAIEWIEKVFELSDLRKHWEHGGEREYKSAYSVFASYTRANPPKAVKEWVESKSRMWGLTPRTIEHWLYTKQALAPDLLKEATSPSKGEVNLGAYHAVAEVLHDRPELQKQIMEKTRAEDLSPKDVRTIAQAVRRAEDEEEVKSILRQPVSRTEEQLVREAKVEKLLSHPREITPLEKYQEARVEDVLYKLDLLAIINSSKGMTKEKIEALTPQQKADVYNTCEQAIAEIQRVMEMVKPAVEAEYLLRGGADGEHRSLSTRRGPL